MTEPTDETQTGDTPPGAAPTWTIVSSVAADGLDAAVARGRILGESSNLARGLANDQVDQQKQHPAREHFACGADPGVRWQWSAP